MRMINPEWRSVIMFFPLDDIPINLSCHQSYNASRNLMTMLNMFLTVWRLNMGTVTCGDLWNHYCSRHIGVDKKINCPRCVLLSPTSEIAQTNSLLMMLEMFCRRAVTMTQTYWVTIRSLIPANLVVLVQSLACWMATIVCRNDMPIETWSIANSKRVILDCDLVCWLIGLFDE